MGLVYHTSDWHLGHKNISKFRGQDGFKGEYDSSWTQINNYSNIIRKNDLVWFHGDIIFDPNYLQVVKDLPGIKKLIMGNHDTEKKRNISISDLVEVFDEIHSLVKYKGSWLSHAPIHPEELRGCVNIHGHTHYHVINDHRYINVCSEQTNYAPIRREKLLENNKAFQEFLRMREEQKRQRNGK